MAKKMTKTRAAAELSSAEAKLEYEGEVTRCKKKPEEYTYPPGSNGPTPSKAQRLCKPCPIVLECSTYGRMFGTDTGLIWGGTFYPEQLEED